MRIRIHRLFPLFPLVALLTAIFWAPSPIQAADYWATYAISGTCDANSFNYKVTVSYSFPTAIYEAVIRTFNGANPFPFNQTFGAGQAGSVSSGPFTVNLAGPLTPPYTIADSITFNANNSSGPVVATGSITMHCDANGVFSGSGSVGNAPAPVVAITVPWWFSMETLTCNTPVYETPGGNVVPNTLVKTGQTWYIDTNPVIDKKGQPWLAVYLVNTTSVYVPASCVLAQYRGRSVHPTIQYDYSLISATCDTNGFTINPNLKLNTSIDLVFKASNYINNEYQYTYNFTLPHLVYNGPGLALPLKFTQPIALPYTFKTIWRLTNGMETYGAVTIQLVCSAKGATVTFNTTYY